MGVQLFVSDCEGVFTVNDFAAELCQQYIPDGNEFFSRLSLYDDYLAEVSKKPDYRAGDTLRLILPFLLAHGVDDNKMGMLAQETTSFIPAAHTTIEKIRSLNIPLCMISASYTPYIDVVSKELGLTAENVFSTRVKLNSSDLEPEEKGWLTGEAYNKIMERPKLRINSSTTIEGLLEEDKETIRELDEIFWNEMKDRKRAYSLMDQTSVVGGTEKCRVLAKLSGRYGIPPGSIIYVGDSITDIRAFDFLNEGKGFSLSFNGNDWAMERAKYLIAANNTLPIAHFAEMAVRYGRDYVDGTPMWVKPKEALLLEEAVKTSKKFRTEVRGSYRAALG